MEISNREKAFLLLGLLLGLSCSGIFIFTGQEYSPPAGHSVSYIRNDVLYNELKHEYLPDVNLTGDMILSIDVDLNGSIYRNAGFKVVLQERVSVDALVFLDGEKNALDVFDSVEVNEVYNIDFDKNDFSGLMLFLNTEVDDFVIQYNLWLW